MKSIYNILYIRSMRYFLLLLLSTAYADICLEHQYVHMNYFSSNSIFGGGVCTDYQNCQALCNADATCVGYSGSSLIDGATGLSYALGITSSNTLAYFGYDYDGISSLANTPNVDSVDAAGSYACILVAGAKTCAGSNQFEQLGNPLSGIDEITLGGVHACALMNDGKIKCWGHGSDTKLGNWDVTGNAPLTNVATPTYVTHFGTPLAGMSRVRASDTHTCATQGSLTGQGASLMCWGDNFRCGFSKAGLVAFFGTCTRTFSSPQTYPALSNNVIDFDVGYYFTCAIKNNGYLYCFGNNKDGRLGINERMASQNSWSGNPFITDTPTTVKKQTGTLSNVVGVSLGYEHGCAWDTSGTAWCWGKGTPYAEQTETGVSKVICTWSKTCYVYTDGPMKCDISGLEDLSVSEYGSELSTTGGDFLTGGEKNFFCNDCDTGYINAAGDDTTQGSSVCGECDVNYKVDTDACVQCGGATTNVAGDPITGADTYCDLADGYISTSGTDVADQCATNYKVDSGACVECGPGTTNTAGDPISGENTVCDAILCTENYHVVNNVCTQCGPEYLHPAGDDASGDGTSCSQCNTDYVVSGEVCVACLPSFSNVAGDSVSGGDTYCDCPPHANFIEANNSCACIEDYYVNQNNQCQICGTGFFNYPGDDPAGSESSCYQKSCLEDEHVQSGECVTCPVGTTRPAGDGTAQGNSQCTPDFCDLNKYVSGNTCVDCAAGYGNPAGDPTSGEDTSCSFIPCAQNHHMSSGLCVACPTGAIRAAGDSDPNTDTQCKCPIDYHVSSGTCQACPAGSTNAPGDDPIGGGTQCGFITCGKNEYAYGSQCLKCASGLYNDPGDSVEFDTTCDDTQLCDNDQYANGVQCLPCAAGESNPAGDLATDVTSCTTDLCTTCCAMNEHVVNGACQSCPDGLTNIAGDGPLGGNTDCDDVVCEENFFAVGDGECDRCPEGSFNLAGDISKEGFTTKPATSCCPAGQFEHMVDLSLGTRECRDCSEIRDRFSMLNCCRGTDLSGQVAQLCDRVLDYYKKVCQPLESADVCPVQNYL
jgi:alpha-tubulin suppressor-like RCC1 family protein